jgi:hypothetical protein
LQPGGVNLATLIRWYIDTFECISPWQRSKQSALEFLEGHPIGQTDPLTLTADVLIDHVRQRRLSGLCPSTVWNDLWRSETIVCVAAQRDAQVIEIAKP